MKKILYSFILLTIITLPVFAANWVEFSTKSYIDTNSIRNSNECGFGSNNKCYSVWTKSFNKNTTYEKRTPNLWYTKSRYIINCKDYEIGKAYSIFYDTNNEKIDKTTQLRITEAVEPETYEESIYNFVCSSVTTQKDQEQSTYNINTTTSQKNNYFNTPIYQQYSNSMLNPYMQLYNYLK